MAVNFSNVMRHRVGEGLSLPVPVPSSSFIFSHLTNSAGSAEMALDVGSAFYSYISSTGFLSLIHRVNHVLYDTAIKPSKFGGMTALTSGIKIETLDANETVLRDFMDGLAIKKHADFGCLSGVDVVLDTGGGGDSVAIRWSLFRASGPLMLLPGESLRYTVQDSLGALTGFTAMVQGYICPFEEL